MSALPPDRIRVLDFLRGLAILGMLIPNVPWHAGDSMSRVHEADVTSVAAWLAQYLVFDQRFMPIFCMLFGAGVVLQYERRGPEGWWRAMGIRFSLLLFIGIAHAYLLWPGDILITYAVCAPFLLAAVRLSVPRLLVIAVLLKAVDLVFAEWPAVYEATLGRWLFAWWFELGPAPSSIADAYAGSYAELLAFNAWRNQFLQWTALPYFRVPNALAFMLAGMALYRSGTIQGLRTPRAYRRLTVTAWVVGGPFVLYGVLARIGSNPTVGPYLGFTAELPLPRLTFAIGCAVASFGVLGGAHLVHRGRDGPLIRAVEAVGRMALTNYLLQSLLFLLLFHGLGVLPFNALDHDALALLAAGTAVVHLILSTAWLKRFPQGPVEAAWRTASTRLWARSERAPGAPPEAS